MSISLHRQHTIYQVFDYIYYIYKKLIWYLSIYLVSVFDLLSQMIILHLPDE